MSKIKQSLSEEAMDALEDVQEGLISEQEWLDSIKLMGRAIEAKQMTAEEARKWAEEYQPQYVDPVEKGGDLSEV